MMGHLKQIKKHPRHIIIVSIILALHLLIFIPDFHLSKGAEKTKKPLIITTKQIIEIPTFHAPVRKQKSSKIPQSIDRNKQIKKKKHILKKLYEKMESIHAQEEIIQKGETIDMPSFIDVLHIDEAPLTTEENGKLTYRLLLAEKLSNTLTLPEPGDIQLKLTLTDQGELKNIETMHAPSTQNAIYLKKALEKITFPPFTKELKGEKTHTFIVRFYAH